MVKEGNLIPQRYQLLHIKVDGGNHSQEWLYLALVHRQLELVLLIDLQGCEICLELLIQSKHFLAVMHQRYCFIIFLHDGVVDNGLAIDFGLDVEACS